MAQSAEHPTLGFGSGHDLAVCQFDCQVGLHADSVDPTWDSLSLLLSLSLSLSAPLLLVLSPFLSKQTNILYKYINKWKKEGKEKKRKKKERKKNQLQTLLSFQLCEVLSILYIKSLGAPGWFTSSSPASGLCADSSEPGDCLCVSCLSVSPIFLCSSLAHSLSLFLLQQ